MDEKSILLMSEELRAAMGERTRASVESQDSQIAEELPGRWSRSILTGVQRHASSGDIRLSGALVRCSSVGGGMMRLIVDMAGGSTDDRLESLTGLTAAVESQSVVRVIAGRRGARADLECRIRTLGIDGGDRRRVSLLVEPAS